VQKPQPKNAAPTVGDTVEVSVILSGAKDISAVPMQIQFDPHLLQLVNVDPGKFLGDDTPLPHREDNGVLTVNAARLAKSGGFNGQGTVCTLTFKVAAAGDSNITFVKVGAKDSSQTAIPANGTSTVVHVK
jgi:general secretion pathway protein D